MRLQRLGYIGIGSRNLADWKEFGTRVIGLQCSDESRSLLGFRADAYQRRVFVDAGLADGSCLFGWEVADSNDLQALANRLEAHGTPITIEPRSLADARCVQEVVSFADPAGNRLEIFHGMARDDVPFTPGRSLSGFRTGALGLGHAVLNVSRISEVLPFYTDLLGFQVSDYMLKPFRAHFLHINARHHSVALIESARPSVHHVMLEMCSLDDVGQALDIALDRNAVSVSLGRHSNDLMTSFYLRTPSPFLIECGWGGREIDSASWQPAELTDGPSLWGHERSWLSQAERDVAKQLRMESAARGTRHPVQVMPGNFVQMTDSCPWVSSPPAIRE